MVPGYRPDLDVILPLLGIAAVAGLLVSAVVTRWRNRDPATPRLTSEERTYRVLVPTVVANSQSG